MTASPQPEFNLNMVHAATQYPQIANSAIRAGPVRIGGASGFWGDSCLGPLQLAEYAQEEPIDFIVFDYLAELTMSILAAQFAKDPKAGYATDFVQVAMRALLPLVASGQLRVVSNAGGINPQACAQALQALAQELGLTIRIATVLGDDVRNLVEVKSSHPNVFTANAYLGAAPIQVALDAGAQVVITGRCVDSAVTLGAVAHWYRWNLLDPNLQDAIAQASLAGHVIECGCQATGGLFTDWKEVPDWANLGYPVIEVAANGDFVVTKPRKTGGLITPASVAEQIVYEVHDPMAYVLPDVICDFTQVRLDAVGDSAVAVRGAKGRGVPSQLKVSATRMLGYRCTAQLTIVGLEASEKAQKTATAIFDRVEALLARFGFSAFSRREFEILGRGRDSFEVVLFMVATHKDKRALELFAREIAPAGTSFSPGTTGASGRPQVVPQIVQDTFFLPRLQVEQLTQIVLDQKQYTASIFDLPALQSLATAKGLETAERDDSIVVESASITEFEPKAGQRLIDIAHARSGDKGDTSNIGVLARGAPEWLWLKTHLRADVVGQLLADWVKGSVVRYPWPGLCGYNFVCEQSLDGGGMASLRNDPLGKGMAQRLLACELSQVLSASEELRPVQ